MSWLRLIKGKPKDHKKSKSSSKVLRRCRHDNFNKLQVKPIGHGYFELLSDQIRAREKRIGRLELREEGFPLFSPAFSLIYPV
jgi:hypothetical protein